MATGEQLKYVQEIAYKGYDKSRQMFLRTWDDLESFERCWAEIEKDAAKQKTYRHSSARTGFFMCLLLSIALVPGLMYAHTAGLNVDEKAWRYGLLPLVGCLYFMTGMLKNKS